MIYSIHKTKTNKLLKRIPFGFSDNEMRKDLWVFVMSIPHKVMGNIFAIILTTNTGRSYTTLILKFPSRMSETILYGGLMNNLLRDLREFVGIFL